MEEEIEPGPLGSRLRPRLFVYLILFLLLVGFIVLWFSRITIADNFVRGELDKRGVEASYEIEDIGFRKQTIRNLVIGDPDKPDLTADLVEIGNSLGTDGAGINWVRATGVKAFGRLRDGKLSFGALDKFSDPEDDSPLALPDISLTLEKAQLRIDSDYGPIGLALNGAGNLHNGFEGELAALSEELELGGCAISKLSYFGEIAISERKPRLDGPLRLPTVQCPELDVSAQDVGVQLALELGQDFTSWTGDAGISSGPAVFSDYSAKAVKSTISFTGDLDRSSGNIDLTTNDVTSPYGRAEIGRVSGPFQIGYGDDPMTARFEGTPEIRSAKISNGLMKQTAGWAASTDETPIGPIAKKLANAIRNAGNSLNLTGDVKFEMEADGTKLAINALNATSRSGGEMMLDDAILLTFIGDDVKMLAEGDLLLNGGGFPDAQIDLNDGSLVNGFSGSLQMAAYQAGTAKLNIPNLDFSPSSGGGTNIDGRIMLSGPFADGQVTGLQIPIKGVIGGRGGFSLYRECVDLQFASLRTAAFVAGPTRTRLCPAGNAGIVSNSGSGVNIAANAPSFDLNGAVGGTPLALSSGALGFSMSKGMTAENVSVRMGTPDSMTKFDMALVSAAFGRVVTGKIKGGEGQIANVPLLFDDVDGDWRFVDGAFLADAQLRVRDAKQVERYRPLISNNVQLKFADGEITADGLLREPTTQRAVATVSMNHRLDNTTGEAIIDVSGLTFDDQLQPEMLTPLTLGVIANVNGAVTGTGRINWDAQKDGVQSTGVFRTDSINLAAAFGPVTGLAGEIRFSDLLSLETAPGQQVRMAEVNPGVAAFNGELFYRLLPDYKMQVEGGQWPFAGGMLYLEPTILDLGEDAERRLEFTVVGVDAAQFLTQFDFENLTATGVFDGKLPMIFDQDGGRIAGGYLVARKGGGSLAYIGELTYEDMGTFANFAFNALKSLKYQQLTIGMDGAIDGEIITEVKFAGLQQGDDASKNFITKQLAKIPLEFNVRIQAPFMQLMSSAKAFYEPEILVGQNLPALLRAQEERAAEAAKALENNSESTVQPRESDNEP
ncbi:intermembrane phospholipid transport protein YdbH family protein [Parasphingorhabdus cellanae]|uniref:YdbH domain-containing protein n=1 Tax=Parasphingorhabdus cellanae TaxID=2806553 RepID=A0ABX7T7A0_9SPHN|nr:YdbH domain-containing protein [Parasphingorhabdus cellanae]QTD56007.1 YdbH domain-containing protein [Parasphingorhabdus cellanae]